MECADTDELLFLSALQTIQEQCISLADVQALSSSGTINRILDAAADASEDGLLATKGVETLALVLRIPSQRLSEFISISSLLPIVLGRIENVHATNSFKVPLRAAFHCANPAILLVPIDISGLFPPC